MNPITNLLNKMIKDKQGKINEIDAEIDEIKERKASAKVAKDKFDESYNELNLLHSDVTSCFKGEAADAFANKVFNFMIFSSSRSYHMEKQINNFKNQLKELEKQRTKASNALKRIEGIKEFFKL